MPWQQMPTPDSPWRSIQTRAHRPARAASSLTFVFFCDAGTVAFPELRSHSIHHLGSMLRASALSIDCGGMAIFPGDVIAGDADSVVVIPFKLATEVARATAEHEQLEVFHAERIREGAALSGTYPPNEKTKAAAYEA